MSCVRRFRTSSGRGIPGAGQQVVVGLGVDRDGVPKAYAVFAGHRPDRRRVDQMLTALEKRVGKKAGATVIGDRGMA